MNLLKELYNTVKKMCNNDDICVMVVFVVIGAMLCFLFKDRISGFSNFDAAGTEHDINLDAKVERKGLERDNSIGIELKPRKPEPTPSTKKQLAVMATKPTIQGNPINQKTGLLIQDASIFRPFDEVWNPGFMPLDMVFKNGQKDVGSSMIGKMGKVASAAKVITNKMGPDRPMTPSTVGSFSGSLATPASKAGSGELSIVLLYAPWCGHSKKMLPDFEKVKSEFHGKTINGTKINIIMYDSDVDKDKVKEYGVKGFPTLFSEKNGVKEPFPHRSYAKISEYLNNI
tara:strand:- start:1586 stop:2443 length:858 start_codon:yes stop_codon:yes gene_type:complete